MARFSLTVHPKHRRVNTDVTELAHEFLVKVSELRFLRTPTRLSMGTLISEAVEAYYRAEIEAAELQPQPTTSKGHKKKRNGEIRRELMVKTA